MKYAELKRCPFCGGTAHMMQIKGCVKERYHVACGMRGCIASDKRIFGKFYETMEDAVEAWNRRMEE